MDLGPVCIKGVHSLQLKRNLRKPILIKVSKWSENTSVILIFNLQEGEESAAEYTNLITIYEVC